MNHAIAAVGTVIIVGASYGLARLGEPSSAWLWCQLIRMCN